MRAAHIAILFLLVTLSFAQPLAQLHSVKVLTSISYIQKADYPEDEDKLDLYLPSDLKVFPVVVFLHGGALMRGDKDNSRHIGQFLASRGVGPISGFFHVTRVAGYRSKTIWGTDEEAWLKASPTQYVSRRVPPILFLYADGLIDEREGLHGDKEVSSGGEPRGVILGEAAARADGVEVGMILELSPPGGQDTGIGQPHSSSEANWFLIARRNRYEPTQSIAFPRNLHAGVVGTPTNENEGFPPRIDRMWGYVHGKTMKLGD